MQNFSLFLEVINKNKTMLSPIIYDFLKARGYPVGTPRTWADGLIRIKQANGKWKLKEGQRRKTKKKTAKKKIVRKKKTAAQKYKDVGEKIGGARKDLAVRRKKQLLSDKSLTVSPSDGQLLEEEGQLKTLLTRDRQFGNIKELYDLAITQGAEENPFIGYAKIAFVDALPAKPPDTKEGREAYLAMTRLVTASLEQITDLESLAKIQDELFKQLLSKPYNNAFSQVQWRQFSNNVRRDRSYISYNSSKYYTRKKYIGGIINDLFRYENNKNKPKEKHERTHIENDEERTTAIAMLDEYFSGRNKKKKVAGEEKPKNPKPSWNRRAQVGGRTAERVGPKIKSAYTSKQLKESFGFRGIEYGNWVKGETAKEHTHFAGMALEDLSRALGIPKKEISLNERLALSFGGRGKGGKRAAVAHYEPLKKAINITKEAGSGSLAHEWFHSLDNVLSGVYAKGEALDYLTDTGVEGGLGEDTQKLETSHRELIRNMLTGSAKPAFLTRKTILPIKFDAKEKNEKIRENWKELGTLATKMGKSFVWSWDRRQIPGSVSAGKEKQYEKIRALSNKLINISQTKYETHKADLNELIELVSKNYPDYLTVNWTRSSRKSANEKSQVFYEKYATHTQKPKEYIIRQSIKKKKYEGGLSNILACSRMLDQGKKVYWSKPIEIAARCFESYIHDKLQEKGEKNDYLVDSAISDESTSKWAKQWSHSIPPNSAPYPIGEERKRINEAFDDFFGALKENNAFQKSIAYLDMLEAKLLSRRAA